MESVVYGQQTSGSGERIRRIGSRSMCMRREIKHPIILWEAGSVGYNQGGNGDLTNIINLFHLDAPQGQLH
jgi:hypothetical protein